ncbi:MAG: hypothetical protein ACRCTJ_04735, partial [Brevinema sp.]
MSHFPNNETFSDKISKKHLAQISNPKSNLIFKKHKGVYLYDLDENKYTDFSLQSGEIFGSHAPKTLTKFIKNALSYGIGHANSYPKFLYKALDLWKKNLESESVTLFPNFLESILQISQSLSKKEIKIGVNSSYLAKKCEPLAYFIEIIDISKKSDEVDLLLWEEIPHLKENPDQIKATKKVVVHSRYLFRRLSQNFDLKYEHLIFSTPFGGKDLVVSTGSYQSCVLTPSDGVLFLEGA